MSTPDGYESNSKASLLSPSAISGATVGSANAPVEFPAAIPAANEPSHVVRRFHPVHDGRMLASYLLDSEVHTFAFSFAANSILSFIPLIVLLYTLTGSVFRSHIMSAEIAELIQYFLPSNQDFVAQNLASVAARHTVQLVSLLMVLVACTGIFLPLEVALNRAWGVVKSRNYIMNQLVALGLAAFMVVLGVLCIALNAAEHMILTLVFFGHIDNVVYRFLTWSWLMLTTSAASILFFFSVYWLMPNRKVPIRPVLRTSVITGLIWVIAKFIFVAFLPRLDLKALYGPFYVSVGLLLWAYVSGLLLFAGAQLSAAHLSENFTHPRDEPTPIPSIAPPHA